MVPGKGHSSQVQDIVATDDTLVSCGIDDMVMFTKLSTVTQSGWVCWFTCALLIWSWTEDDISWWAPLTGCSWANWIHACWDGVPVSAWTGTLVLCRPPHPNLWCCSLLTSTICQPELSHCALLPTQHIRLSGVPLCWNSFPLNLEIWTALTVFNSSWKQFSSHSHY